MRDDVIDQIVDRTIDRLRRLDLLMADQALVDARRVRWVAFLEDRELPDVAAALRVSELALIIATDLAGLAGDEFADVILRAFGVIWRAAYPERLDAFRDPSKAGPLH